MASEKQILNNEYLLKFFFEKSPDIFWIISSDLKHFFYLSPNLEKLYQIKRSDIATPEDLFSKIVFYKDKHKPLEGVQKIILSHAPHRFDYRIKLKDGSIRWIRDFAFPIQKENNEIYIGGISRDITSNKMHELRRDLRHNLSRVLYEADSLSAAMPKILSTICSSLEWKIGVFWILDRNIEKLRFFSSWSNGEKDLNVFEEICQKISFGKGDFFVGKSLTEQKALFQKNLIEVPEFSRAPQAKDANIKDGCVFPIKLKNAILGVLEFFNDEMDDMDDYTLDFFTDLGVFIGYFIEEIEAKEKLKEREELFRKAFYYSVIGMALTTIEGAFCQINNSLCEMLGFSKNEFLEKNYKNLIHPDDLSKNSHSINQLLGGQIPSFQTSVRFLSKSGIYVWVILSASLVKDANNLPLNIIFQIQDISYVQSLKDKLIQLTQYDVVTRLPNRQLFENTLQQSILITSLSQKKAVIFIVDIDRFKLMSEPWNPQIIDKLFLEIGQRLNIQIQAKDILGRLEGGEFAILFSKVPNDQEIHHILNLIFNALKAPFLVEERQFYVTASVGVSLFPDDATLAHELINNAYIAMNTAKKKGGNSHQFFAEEMLLEEQENLKIEICLRDAIEKNELSIAIQPIFLLENGLINSAEVLLRWNSETLGQVPPSKFIPVAEKSGQIIELGNWILDQAIHLAKKMSEEGISPITLSINLSPRQIFNDQFYDDLIQVFDKSKMKHQQFRFEITETQLVENFHLLATLIARLKEASFEFAIDDFGVGYSSFNYLKNFFADRIKIDRSFIRNLHREPKSAAITEAIIAMCQKLNIIPIAEGVETQEELNYLKSIGCIEAQGFFLSHSLKEKEFIDLLKKNCGKI